MAVPESLLVTEFFGEGVEKKIKYYFWFVAFSAYAFGKTSFSLPVIVFTTCCANCSLFIFG